MTSQRFCLIAAATTLLSAGVSSQEAGSGPWKGTVAQQQPAPKVDRARSTDWSLHNGDIANSRYSSLDQINAANVSRLALKWTFEIPLSDSASGISNVHFNARRLTF